MKIYTRTGDRGETGLFGGGRVAKHHPRVAAYGDVDELNSVIGWALCTVEDPDIRKRLILIQPDLFTIGSHLATPPTRPGRRRPELPPLPAERITEFEHWIDDATAELPELREFILPGGSPGAATLHVARTVCRRAERSIIRLAAEPPARAPAGETPAGAATAPTDDRTTRTATGDTAAEASVDPSIPRYLNRLSDLLFTFARLENHRAGVEDRRWNPDVR